MAMRRLLTGIFLSLVIIAAGGNSQEANSAQKTRPNIILIIGDDQSYRLMEDMLASTNPVSPFKTAMLDQGISFTSAYVAAGLCCPSRASILTGKYPHNHRVLINENGYGIFNSKGLDAQTLAVWLNPYYRTAMIGKYLNEFPVIKDANGKFIDVNLARPQGWDDWQPWFPGLYSDSTAPDQSYPPDPNPATPGDVTRCRSPLGKGTNFYNLFMYDQAMGQNTGTLYCYEYDPTKPNSNYSTSIFEQRALTFLEKATKGNEPFFLYLSPNGPHAPHEPHPDHTEAKHPDWFDLEYSELYDEPNGAFNEQDISDKYNLMSQFPLLTPAAIDKLDHNYRQTLRTQLSIDQMVSNLVNYLTLTGAINNTYIIYVSDHGLLYGDHRIGKDGTPGKNYPYDADVRVPLVIRGPDVPEGVTRDHLVVSTDLAPTIAALAKVSYNPLEVDGSSLVPLLSSKPVPYYKWRGRIAMEGSNKALAPDKLQWSVARIQQYITVGQNLVYENMSYIERPVSKEAELYNMILDPFQLENSWTYTPGNPPPTGSAEARYQRYLTELVTCKGQQSCRNAEGFPRIRIGGAIDTIPLPLAPESDLTGSSNP